MLDIIYILMSIFLARVHISCIFFFHSHFILIFFFFWNMCIKTFFRISFILWDLIYRALLQYIIFIALRCLQRLRTSGLRTWVLKGTFGRLIFSLICQYDIEAWLKIIHFKVNPLSANPTKWANSNNSSAVANELFWVCLTILWSWRLKRLEIGISKDPSDLSLT